MSLGGLVRVNVVVDASVGVKWLVPESHAGEASLLMSNQISRHVPALFYTEVSQTIWKKVHSRREITPDEGREIFARLRRLPLIIHPMDALFDLSFEIALRTGRSVYDSVYLALAQTTGWKFVTADEKLFNGLKGTKFESVLIWVADVPSFVPPALVDGEDETPDVPTMAD